MYVCVYVCVCMYVGNVIECMCIHCLFVYVCIFIYVYININKYMSINGSVCM